MIISSNISKNDFEKVIGFFLLWILVGFLTLLFLIFSYLRRTEYNKKHLKKFFDDTDWTFVCVATGYLAPIIVFVIYISNKLSSKKDNIFGWLYDILYKIANIGVKKKLNISYRLKYEFTYLKLKYYLDRVLKNKKDSWVNYTTRYDRGIGKTVSVARLSAKYDIPVFVKNNMCKRFIENEVPKYLPRYFKKRNQKQL